MLTLRFVRVLLNEYMNMNMNMSMNMHEQSRRYSVHGQDCSPNFRAAGFIRSGDRLEPPTLSVANPHDSHNPLDPPRPNTAGLTIIHKNCRHLLHFRLMFKNMPQTPIPQ